MHGELQRLAGESEGLVVLDEAYRDFCGQDCALLTAHSISLDEVTAVLRAAGTLILSLGTDPLQQQTPRFIDIQRTRPAPESRMEVLTSDGYPSPLRSRCWWIAGGYGLGAAFASIAGIIAESVVRGQTADGSTRNVRTHALGMLIGFAVGVGPGMLLGNEARKEDNGLARGVTTVLAGSQAHSRWAPPRISCSSSWT